MNTKNVNAKNESAKLTKINFEKFATNKQLWSEKTSSTQRSTLYIYPENWSAIQINSQEGKSFRTKRRKQLMNFANLINMFFDKKNSEGLLNEIKEFNKFYKEFFKLNDFSINSITNVKGEMNEVYTRMLNIIKDVNSVTDSPKKEKKVIAPKKEKTVKKELPKEDIKTEISEK